MIKNRLIYIIFPLFLVVFLSFQSTQDGEAQKLRYVFSKESAIDKRAEKAYEELKDLNKESPTAMRKKWNEIVTEDKELARRISIIGEEKTGKITSSDKTIKNLGVSNGDRAKMIIKQLNKLKTAEEKKALWNDYVEKKIITNEVAEQIKELMELE